MTITHSLKDLRQYHREASNFFAAELTMLKEVLPLITDEKQAKISILLMSAGQTGAALLQLASQTDVFTDESTMLARSFIEKLTNFCYLCVCDEQEYKRFLLHPIYKQYHLTGNINWEDNIENYNAYIKEKENEQKRLKQIPLVQEALALFSETKSNLNWTKKTISERIKALQDWGKMLDVFFFINKDYLYSKASEALHGSLFGCGYELGFDHYKYNESDPEYIDKKLYRQSTSLLIHLGFLIHETFTVLQYTNAITELWDYSYENRNNAFGLLYHVLEKKMPGKKKE
ncbi:MAG: hypothetical protein J0I09_08055 [Sphingobacteriia bacterium]|nr:hypothetical protein [Sphingobacteriia bacterium]